MKIGIKYCGGCNPVYDRVEAVRRLREQISPEIELVSCHDENADIILIVAGCATACVSKEEFAGRPVRVITGTGDLECMIKKINDGSRDFKNSPE